MRTPMTSDTSETAARGPRMKPWIEAIHAYVPGKSAGADGKPLVKLSANENPLGTSERALAARGGAAGPAIYPDPDCKALRAKIGELHGLNPAQIVCGTGSDEILNLAAQAFAGPGDEIIHVRYGFAVYDIATRRCGATPVVAPDRDYGTDVDALLACVTPNTRVVFVANPNNPTGRYIGADEMARLHAGLPADVLLVVDQAYGEYLEEGENDGGIALAKAHGNVLVTRTFSKIYGIASARVGWATGAPHLIDALNRIRGPFNVSGAGQAGALAAVRDQDFIRHCRSENAQTRAAFVARLESLGNRGVRALPSEANFVLAIFPDQATAERVRDAIADAGYAVRHLPGQGLGDALRITIGRKDDMAKVGDAIEAALGN